jgi:hypothetical protein
MIASLAKFDQFVTHHSDHLHAEVGRNSKELVERTGLDKSKLDLSDGLGRVLELTCTHRGGETENRSGPDDTINDVFSALVSGVGADGTRAQEINPCAETTFAENAVSGLSVQCGGDGVERSE